MNQEVKIIRLEEIDPNIKYINKKAMLSAVKFVSNNKLDVLYYKKLVESRRTDYLVSEECPTENIKLAAYVETNVKNYGIHNNYSIWIKKAKSYQAYAILHIHEYNHVIAMLNSKIRMDHEIDQPYKHYGFAKLYLHEDKLPKGHKSEIGLGLDEFVNEFISQMQYIHNFKKDFPKIIGNATADTVFKKNQKLWPESKDCKYKKDMAIPKL